MSDSEVGLTERDDFLLENGHQFARRPELDAICIDLANALEGCHGEVKVFIPWIQSRVPLQSSAFVDTSDLIIAMFHAFLFCHLSKARAGLSLDAHG